VSSLNPLRSRRSARSVRTALLRGVDRVISFIHSDVPHEAPSSRPMPCLTSATPLCSSPSNYPTPFSRLSLLCCCLKSLAERNAQKRRACGRSTPAIGGCQLVRPDKRPFFRSVWSFVLLAFSGEAHPRYGVPTSI
jgi:hypothetical protein